MLLSNAAAMDVADVYAAEQTSARGLSDAEALRRLQAYGANSFGERRVSMLVVALRQVRNPLLVLLLATAIVSAFLGEVSNAYIIVAIIALSVGLGFFNEYRSERAMADLHRRVRHRAVVVRGGISRDVDVAQLVPGDVVVLSLGDIVPADVRLCTARDFTCGEAVLTGESMPAEKSIAAVADAGISGDLRSCALMGTTVESGEASGVVIATGARTQFGSIAAHLADQAPATAFEVGLSDFSKMLVNVTIVLTASIFAINTALHHPLIDALLFSLAIAVGLTPQLLPAIVTVSLATGARRLAQKHVIVKRLVSIEDFGNVQVLFTDKTGTLTEGEIRFSRAIDLSGSASAEIESLALACTDVAISTIGVAGGTPLDRALWGHALVADPGRRPPERLASLSFDYDRKMMSVLLSDAAGCTLVVKGAPEAVIARCIGVDAAAQRLLDQSFAAGARVVAVATRSLNAPRELTAADEVDLTLRGFVLFDDPVKSGAADSIALLSRLGIDVRIITGDNEIVAGTVCTQLGMRVEGVLTGAQIQAMSDPDLQDAIAHTTIFARVNPEQKSRIIRLQRARGLDVGFLGDGVNDAVALHYADVGISVDSGTDVAKDAADIILLDKDLGVLAEGVMEGRRIFGNTIKYVLMGTSSNFGNMFSAAGASLFLPFLPMTAPQILLNNLLYDVSEMAIPTDSVDQELLQRSSQWNVAFIRRFMIVFGPISSLFDYLTYAVMLFVFHAGSALFQSGWFVESLATQSLIVFVIRTRRIPFFRSRPSTPLLMTTVGVTLLGMLLPFSPAARLFGFTPLPLSFFLILLAMIAAYLALVELAKAWFYRPHAARPAPEARQRRRVRRVAARWIH